MAAHKVDWSKIYTEEPKNPTEALAALSTLVAQVGTFDPDERAENLLFIGEQAYTPSFTVTDAVRINLLMDKVNEQLGSFIYTAMAACEGRFHCIACRRRHLPGQHPIAADAPAGRGKATSKPVRS